MISFKPSTCIRKPSIRATIQISNHAISCKQCVAVDAVVEDDLASALEVRVFPELIFTKAGKILYREKGMVNFFFFWVNQKVCSIMSADCDCLRRSDGGFGNS